jgi:hypothetical protein
MKLRGEARASPLNFIAGLSNAAILFDRYIEAETTEIQTLVANWDQATYPNQLLH